MKDPFCPHIRYALRNASAKLNPVIGGTYHTTPLSVFETEAEVQSIYASGATIVGQVCGQEAICARLTEICYATINPVANWAEGLGTVDDWDMGNYYERIAVPMASVIWATLENIVLGHSCPSFGVGIDTYTKGE
jgi:purine nucleoside phosphorylase